MRAIETTGILNTQGQIQLDHPIPQDKARSVRVILLIPEEELNRHLHNTIKSTKMLQSKKSNRSKS